MNDFLEKMRALDAGLKKVQSAQFIGLVIGISISVLVAVTLLALQAFTVGGVVIWFLCSGAGTLLARVAFGAVAFMRSAKEINSRWPGTL